MLGLEFKKHLRSVSRDILLEGDFHAALAPAITKYHQLLCEMVGVDPNVEQDRAHMETEKGNAIGTFWAANCVKEIFRTQRFVKGLAQAVKDELGKGKKTVHVLYAGTGPFAALALPIMLAFQPTEVQFTLLEINKNSYEKLHSLLQKLDLLSYVKSLELVDATNYTLKNCEVDIVLSETMNLALFKEPQVSIMMNLGQQLKDSALYLPEEIKVTLCKQKGGNSLIPLKPLIQFNQSLVVELLKRANFGKEMFEEINVDVDLALGDRLCYLTEIQIYKGMKLGLNDSSLTLLKFVKPPLPIGPNCLNIQYQIGRNPGFVVETGSLRVQNSHRTTGEFAK